MQEENQHVIEGMRAITVSREYGSGGGEIAARLARRLGWQLIDHEVVIRVAEELGVSEEEAAAHDEYRQGLLERILTSMQGMDPAMLTVLPMVPAPADEDAYRKALENVVDTAVARGHVVIVGRASQVHLSERRDAFHLRIVAPLEVRINYVMQREKLSQDAARSRIQLKDRDRARYLQEEYHQHPEDPHLYDMVVKTGTIDLDSIVEMVVLAVACKGRTLGVSEGALGPGAGLSPYVRQPGDFRPPDQVRESAVQER